MNSAKLKAIMELIDQMEEKVLSKKKGDIPETGKVKITKVAVMPNMMEDEDEDNEDLATSIIDKKDEENEEIPTPKKEEGDEDETSALERLRKRFSGK